VSDNATHRQLIALTVSPKEIKRVISALHELMAAGSLRLDPQQEHDLAALNSMLSSGQSDRAWSLLLKILQAIQEKQDVQHSHLQEAFNSLIEAVMALENEMLAAYQTTNATISSNGQHYDSQMADYVGGLAQEIDRANSLDNLKTTAVAMLTKMRQTIHERRIQEQALLASSQKEMEKLQNELTVTRSNLDSMLQENKQIEVAAFTCPLTNIGNKRALDKFLSYILADQSLWPFCLAVLDVDNFKKFNDEFGHQTGDKVLITITQQVLANIRSHDRFFRYAGDEFVLLFNRIGIDEAQSSAERVRKAIEGVRFKYKGETLKITISTGLTEVKKDDTNISLFERADGALFESKRKARNCVSIA
jgi:diguanylate cyclase (GGDEF)-like protein